MGIRLYFGHNPVWISPQVAHESTDYGFRPIPNQKNVFTIDKPVTTNMAGFRDDHWIFNDLEDTYRILIVGDSFTFGNGVNQDEIFSAHLERMLERDNRKFNVLNASAGGWNINEVVGFVQQEASSLQPDCPIYAFFYNDYDNAPSQRRIFSPKGRIDSRPSWLKWLSYEHIYLLKRSALLWMIRDRVGIVLF